MQEGCRRLLLLLILCATVHFTAAKWPFLPNDQDLLTVLQQMQQGPIARPNITLKDVDNEFYTRYVHTYPCTDVQCSGWLYVPRKPIDGSSKAAPVIVMGHGLGGTKSWLDGYASTFAKNGFAVFSFDYRYWGASEGQPRQWISVAQQLEDWRSAVAYVQSKLGNQVDAERLSLWGTSFAGGHVITTAAALRDQIKSVVSQVPHLDGTLASMISLRNRGTVSNAVLAMAALADSNSVSQGVQPFYVPLGGPLKSLSIMQLNEEEHAAYMKLTEQRHSEGWHNLTRASFVLELANHPYSPINSVGKLSAPLMIVAATRDSICPYAAARLAVARANNAELVPVQGMHFDIYAPPYRDEAVAKQLEFLKKNAV